MQMKNCRQRIGEKRRDGGGDDVAETKIEMRNKEKRTVIKCSSGVREGGYQISCKCVCVCVYLCCRLKQTQGSFVEACSSFYWPPQGG